MVEALSGQSNGFRSTSGLGTGEKGRGEEPREQQVHETRPQSEACWGKALMSKPHGLKTRQEAEVGDFLGVSPGDVIPGRGPAA